MADEITASVLNTSIVKMRKLMERAKLHCNRKIIQQIKIIKSKNGTEEQLLKNARKIQRLAEEVKEIKKMNNDELSKFVLLNTKSYEELHKTEPTSASKIAMYKVATSNLLIDFIDEFRAKYKSWPIEIPFLLQRLGLQYKNRKKLAPNLKKMAPTPKPSRSLTKKSKTVVDRKIDDLRANDASKEDEKVREPENPNSAISVEKLNNRSKKKQISLSKASTSEMTENVQLPEDRTSNENSTDRVLKKKRISPPKSPAAKIGIKKEKATKNPKVEKPVRKNNAEMEVKRLNLGEISTDEFLLEISVSKTSKSKFAYSTAAGISDPFFDFGKEEKNGGKMIFRKNDATYDRDTDNGDNLNTNRLKPNIGSKSRYSNTLSGRPAKNSFPKKSAPFGKQRKMNANMIPLGKPENQISSNIDNRRMRREKMRKEAARQVEAANLHPSWQAKRKLQSTILLPSVGKKIKFNDD